MTEFNQIAAAGRQILDEWLTLTQRKRGPSDDPQLSFIVDGVLALLRPWPDPLNSWDLFRPLITGKSLEKVAVFIWCSSSATSRIRNTQRFLKSPQQHLKAEMVVLKIIPIG